MQRVGYAVVDDELTRYTWSVLDRAQDTLPLEQPLTGEINGMSVRYLTEANEWESAWPQANPPAPTPAAGTGFAAGVTPPGNKLPRAVEVTLEHTHYGDITWLFRMPQ